MKKSLLFILGIIVVVGGIGVLFVIHNNNNDGNTTTNNKILSNNGNVLVVYYSATGSTEKVANMIANNLNADLFEIEPTEEYTSSDLNWSDNNSRVTREHNDESLRDISLKVTTPSKWDSYDTIILGYPIWWGEAAWVVNNFVKNNDFSGKSVIPFCTSASSGLGESDKKLEELSNSGKWMQGKRFSSSATEEEVNDWVKGLK